MDMEEMKMKTQTYETVMETDEFITAEVFLERRRNGQTRPENVRIVPPSREHPTGGFQVMLETPRYRADIGKGPLHAR
jgi:hypothetical protein